MNSYWKSSYEQLKEIKSQPDGSGVTDLGNHVPPEAMKQILIMKGYIQDFLVDPNLQIRYAIPRGQTFEEMRSNVQKTDLYNMGDCIMIWINEGDFSMLTFHYDVLECRTKSDDT